MASKSTTTYLSTEVNDKLYAIRTRLNFIAAGTPESDRAADLLRELSATLDAVDERASDLLIAAASRR